MPYVAHAGGEYVDTAYTHHTYLSRTNEALGFRALMTMSFAAVQAVGQRLGWWTAQGFPTQPQVPNLSHCRRRPFFSATLSPSVLLCCVTRSLSCNLCSAYCARMDLQQQTVAKLVLLGEMGSGKSSLVLRYVKGQFFDFQVRSWHA